MMKSCSPESVLDIKKNPSEWLGCSLNIVSNTKISGDIYCSEKTQIIVFGSIPVKISFNNVKIYGKTLHIHNKSSSSVTIECGGGNIEIKDKEYLFIGTQIDGSFFYSENLVDSQEIPHPVLQNIHDGIFCTFFGWLFDKLFSCCSHNKEADDYTLLGSDLGE